MPFQQAKRLNSGANAFQQANWLNSGANTLQRPKHKAPGKK